jgi:predicted DNA-binding transcriptional regulator YafY
MFTEDEAEAIAVGVRLLARTGDPGLQKVARGVLSTRNRPTGDGEWVRALLARKPTKVAAVALANKTARIVLAVMMRADGYRAKEVLGLPA